MKNQPVVVFDPNPFCYGSIASLLSITPHLKGVHKILLATDCTAELADDTFDEVIECDVKKTTEIKKIIADIGKINLYVSISNTSNSALVEALNIPFVFVDILFWTVNDVHKAMRNALVYIIEGFPGVSTQIEKFKSVFNSYEVVGPFVKKIELDDNTKKNQLLINLGGGESPYLKPGENTNYPVMVTKAILAALDASTFDKIIIATGKQAVRCIQAAGLKIPPNIIIATLPQERFLKELNASRLFLTSPGVNATMEGLTYRIPTFFLPPQNLTQVLQLQIYHDFGLRAAYKINLTDLYPTYSFDRFGNEKEQTGLVMELLNLLNTDLEKQNKLSQSIQSYLRIASNSRHLNQSLVPQDKFIRTFDRPGGEKAAQIILDYL